MFVLYIIMVFPPYPVHTVNMSYLITILICCALNTTYCILVYLVPTLFIMLIYTNFRKYANYPIKYVQYKKCRHLFYRDLGINYEKFIM